MKVALTGNIGSGKSTIAEIFKELGAEVTDCDQIIRNLWESDNPASQKLKKIFPEALENGEISRKKLADVVFSDKTKLSQLESLAYAIMYQKLDEWYASLPENPLAVVEAALIFEKNQQTCYDKTIAVYISKKVAKRRKLARGMTEEDFERRWEKQMPPEKKAELADFVISNSGNLEEARDSAREIFNHLYVLNALWQITDKPTAEVVLEKLDEYYKGRHYHNLNHVVECLKEFQQVKHIAQNPKELMTALLFHDAVYDPKANDNEEKSAELARNFCKSEKVKTLILATKHDSQQKDNDTGLIVDLDLAILGKPAKNYDQYSRSIRKEYSWASEEDFRKGRAHFIRHFLAKPRLYQTEFFRDKYETQARENLQKELERLINLRRLTYRHVIIG